MPRFDNIGMFWADMPTSRKASERIRVRPPVPETGWKAPREFPNLAGARVLSFDTETKDPELLGSGPGWGRHRGHIVGFSIGAKDGAGNVGQWYFPIRHEDTPEDNLDAEQCLRWAKAQLETPHIPKVGANLTYDYGWLLEEGIRVQGPLFDVQFAEALLDERARVGLDVLAAKYLNDHKQGSLLYRWCADFYGGNPNDTQRKNIYRSPPSLVGPYGEADAALPLQIMEHQWPLLAKEGLLDLFHMECELIPLMVEMRMKGVPVNVDLAEQMYDGFGKEVAILNQRLRDMVGFGVNVNSADDLARAFKAHNIPFALTAKGKPSFTADFLEDVEHPVGQLVVDIRQREKLRSVFIKSYILDNHVNGVVHGTFNQLRGEGGGTRSGRFSCVDADTLLDTDNGPRAIKDVRVGDKVWTHKRRYRAVTHKWRKGVEQMFRVTFSDHNVIMCTAAHRFLTTTGWRTLKDIMHASIQTNSGRSIQHCGKPAPVSRHVTGSDNATDWRYPWCKLQSRDGNSCDAYDTGRKTCACEDTLFGVENSRQESDVWRSRRRTSQLAWLVRGWRRVSNLLAQWQTRSRAASCNGTGTWVGNITKDFRGSSYRLRQKEQRAGQFSACDPVWSSDVTFPSARGRDQITIAQIESCGNREVWDITVDEDSSYSACGVFSHNSDTPNLQNIPIRTEIGKRIRSLFADKYLPWRKYDYSQIEYRCLAHFAVDKGDGSADRVRAAYAADPKTDYHVQTQNMVRAIAGLDISRSHIKNMNFGLIYGMGEPKLARQLGVTASKAKEMFTAYHAGAPYAKATMLQCIDEAQLYGTITTILGRKSRFDLWQPAAFGVDGAPTTYSNALMRYGNIKRAYTHKALNRRLQGSAADLMKKAMHQCYVSGVFAETGYPALTVHDELDFIDPGGKDEAFNEMQRIMETCIPLRVPVIADYEIGISWGTVDDPSKWVGMPS